MEPANGAHSDDPWANEKFLVLIAGALPPLPDIGDSSKGNLQLAIGPPPSSSSSSSGSKKQDYKWFTRLDMERLIEGVKNYGRDWIKIMDCYFKGSGRTANQLKDKWIHMLKSANNERNHPYKELYLKAKNVDACYPTRYFRRSSASDTHVL